MKTAIRLLFVAFLLHCHFAQCKADTTPIVAEVVIEFYVDAQGKTTDIHVIKATSEKYAKLAVKAVQKWILTEKYRNTKMTIPILFSEPQESEPSSSVESKKEENF
jgi:TonB family protein